MNEIEAAAMRIFQEEFTRFLKVCHVRGLHPAVTARMALGACIKVMEAHPDKPWHAGNRNEAKREAHIQISEIGHDEPSGRH